MPSNDGSEEWKTLDELAAEIMAKPPEIPPEEQPELNKLGDPVDDDWYLAVHQMLVDERRDAGFRKRMWERLVGDAEMAEKRVSEIKARRVTSPTSG
ncbi:hypothetical protein [Algiphilus sp.]|uniref:hypothetical protein n=1 Tax=Algiphilus sp. TaxID=1872431 RepID=UPI0032EAAEF3